MYEKCCRENNNLCVDYYLKMISIDFAVYADYNIQVYKYSYSDM